jgi:periplasmic protein TonB
MTPLTRELEVSPSNPGAPTIAKPQPVAVEIPITVNGARTVAGSDKREPFSETTQTVLVFGSGAVIRLGAAVGPGQLLFVTNEKSRREVVCQVVKSKQNGNAGGYVELKFTEPAADFWGVRIPATLPVTAGVTDPGPSLPTKSLEQKLSELQSVPTPKVVPETAKSVEKPAAAVREAAAVPTGSSGSETKEPNAAQVISMPVLPAALSTASAPRVPTLSEFLTHGENGVELNHGKPKAAKTDPASDSPAARAEMAVPQRASLPSSLPENAPTLSTALQITQNPAPGSLSFDLAAEEVKIPSWLEPLARNSASSNGNAAEEGIGIEPSGIESPAANLSASQEGAENSADGGVLTIASEGPAPNFGSSLAVGSPAEETSSSGKGWKIAVVIIALLLGAAAVWYWYVNQPPKVSASGNRDAGEGLESVRAPVPNSDTSAHESPAPSSMAPGVARTAAQPIPSELGYSAPASTKPLSGNGARAARPEAPAEIPVEEPAKKSALGAVHLAAPVVSHNSASEENGAADPGLAMNGVAGAAPNSLSMLSSNQKEPAAPITVGGEVKPAKLLSSVPPGYPQMARTQRVSGDVTIDASIDAAGRVSATRVISGPTLLHQAAIDAVKQWKYQPATLNGQATAMHLTVTVQFRLQ